MEKYIPTVEFEVYSKKITANSKHGPAQLRVILLTKRLTYPTEDQVVDYITEKAIELKGRKYATQENSDLEKAILSLPKQNLKLLREGDENCLDYIRMHTPALNLKPGKKPVSYLSTRYGVLEEEIIQNSEHYSEEPDWYHTAFSNDNLQKLNQGENFRFQIKIEDGKLTPISRIRNLISENVTKSKTFITTWASYNEKKLNELIDFIYSTFPDKERLSQVPDISPHILEDYAFDAVISLKDFDGIANSFQSIETYVNEVLDAKKK